jgi:hypothetical protein
MDQDDLLMTDTSGLLRRWPFPRAVRVSLIVLLVTALSLFVLSSNQGRGPRSVGSGRTVHQQAAAHTSTITITPGKVSAAEPPPGYGRPLGIVSDPTGGIWYLAGSVNDVSLFHWNPLANDLSQYSLGNPQSNDALQYGDEGGLAVTTAGTVWVGLQQTLSHLVDGTVSSVLVPNPTDNPYVEARRPPAIQGFHGIEAIAVSPTTGDVAVAMEAARSVTLYDPSSRSFSSIPLPENDAPLSVAYTNNGVLVVTAVDWPSGSADSVDVISTTLSIQRSQLGALAVSSAGDGVLTTGVSGVDLVDPEADSTPTVSSVYAPSGADVPIDPEVEAVSGPNDADIVATTTGLLIVPGIGQSPVTVTFPTFQCNAVTAVPISATGSTGAGECQLSARSVAVDNDGNIWLTENISPSIFEVPSSAY